MTKQTAWLDRLRPLFICLSLLSLAWVSYILWDTWPKLKESFNQIEPRLLLLSLAGTTFGGYLSFEVFYLLFTEVRPNTYKRLSLAHLYFTGQSMKHLPGRIWGVAYQAITAKEATLKEWASVNIFFMLLTMFFSVLAASLAILSFHNQLLLVIFTTSLFVIYFLAWNSFLFKLIFSILERATLGYSRKISNTVLPLSKVSPKLKIKILILMLCSWLFYYFAWGVFGYGWPGLGFQGGLLLCALYTLAWFIGYITFITPSGAGIREIAFLFLAKDFPPDTVAVMIIFGRVILLISDLILGLAFLKFRTLKVAE